ncbi:MAG: DNA recombination protein RmuC [Muribaculaceae bacterium]|nr:DNA recombination protein RmuC [Muribaculaceae bacterium]
MGIIIAICCLILGLIGGVVLGKSMTPNKDQGINELKRLLTEKETYLEAKQGEFQTLLKEKEDSYSRLLGGKEQDFEIAIQRQEENHQREINNLKESNAKLMESVEKNHRDSMQTLKSQFAETTEALSSKLKVATEEILKQREKEFSESSGERIDKLLEPLKTSLQAMQEKVAENTNKHSELGGQLSASIKNLLDHTESAKASADRLATMLKGNAKHQGEWGERILKEILESLNLQEGIHFDLQQTFTDEAGRALKNEEGRMGRPDVILHLDENKDVIIDSKVSLSAYLQYQEATTDEERQEALKKHIASIEKHVNELVKKDYTKYVSRPRILLGYVIMFVPNTSALLLATNNKPTLWREAMEKNVYIADEQTLYAALKIVSLTWQQVLQNANHTKVFELAEEMIQRVGNFIKSYDTVGENLNKALKSFEEGRRKLEDGGQSIPQTCRKLIKLGAKVPKLPKGFDKTMFEDLLE